MLLSTLNRPYLFVLYLAKSGKMYEVYNGSGTISWNSASNKSNQYRRLTINKLMKLDSSVAAENRIVPIHPIEQMKKEFKNKKHETAH